MAHIIGRHWKILACTSASLACSYFYSHCDQTQLIRYLPSFSTVHAAEYERGNISKLFFNNQKKQVLDTDDDDDDDDDDKDENDGLNKSDENVTNFREKRFRDFASIEYNGDVYMTPVDFLESVIAEYPRPRIGRRQLTDEMVESTLYNTPSKHRGSKKFFRSLEDGGLISFTEYLFLWVILTEPISQIDIAFNMFDTDGNQLVDKHEFTVLGKSLGRKPLSRRMALRKSVTSTSTQTALVLGNVEEPDTTLLIHFFGKNGRDTLNYTEFRRFMENFQLEILEIEFNEFSHGFKTISDLDFAEILLRYTKFDRETKKQILKKVRKSTDEPNAIAFDEFKKFFDFLNHLDEFNIAMRFHQLSNKPISQAEFRRAVKISTGFELNSHIIGLIFRIFDTNNDQHLSYDEFMLVMKDRLSRGFDTSYHMDSKQSKFEQFKYCFRERAKNETLFSFS